MCPTMNCCSNKTYNIHNTDDRLFQLMHHSIGYSSQHNPVLINYKRRKLLDWQKDIKDGDKRWSEDNNLAMLKNKEDLNSEDENDYLNKKLAELEEKKRLEEEGKQNGKGKGSEKYPRNSKDKLNEQQSKKQ